MNKITYTFPADCPLLPLRGKTVTGGVFGKRIHNGKALDVVNFATWIDGKPVCAIVAGKPELEAALIAHQADIAAKNAALLAAQAEFEKTPEGQREKLVIEEYNTYSENHYPGSQAWHKNNDAQIALREFDAAHPELAAQIKAARIAKGKADYDALSDFVKMGS